MLLGIIRYIVFRPNAFHTLGAISNLFGAHFANFLKSRKPAEKGFELESIKIGLL